MFSPHDYARPFVLVVILLSMMVITQSRPDVIQGEESSRMRQRLQALQSAPNQPPVADAGHRSWAPCLSPAGFTYTFDGSGSTDPDTPGTNDDIVLYEWFEDFGLPSQTLLATGKIVEVDLPLGDHEITLRVTDTEGLTDTDTVSKDVYDDQRPELTVDLSPDLLVPPNHRMVEVTATVSVEDLCETPPLELAIVASNEPDDVPGGSDGHTTGDIQGVALGTHDLSFFLRAERLDTGEGRTYTIMYRSTDSSGNTGVASARIKAPHDRRKSRRSPPAPIITTVAGGGAYPDGADALSMPVGRPSAITMDLQGNTFIALTNLHRILKVDPGGTISSYAGNGEPRFGGDGGPATEASLFNPIDVAADAAGNLFIIDSSNRRIRTVNAGNGIISTVIGGGHLDPNDGTPAKDAYVGSPDGLAVTPGGSVYYSDWYAVYRIDAITGLVFRVAGNGTRGFGGDGGPARDAQMNWPAALALSANGDLAIADTRNNRIRQVDALTGIITTVAGNGKPGSRGDGGPALDAAIGSTRALTIDSSGHLFISGGDYGEDRIRRVDSGSGTISTIVRLSPSGGVVTDAAGNLFFSDPRRNMVRSWNPVSGTITTLAGDGTYNYYGDGGLATDAGLGYPSGVAVDSRGDIYVLDRDHFRVRRVNARTGIISTIAGTGERGFTGDEGPATSARLGFFTGHEAQNVGLVMDPQDNLFIGDQWNLRVRRVDSSTGIISTFAGNGRFCCPADGIPATQAALPLPFEGLATDGGGHLFIAASDHSMVERVDAVTGILTIVAGGYPTLHFPTGVAVDSSGNLFIADGWQVLRMDAVTGDLDRVAGGGRCCLDLGDGGLATDAYLQPFDLVLDRAGNIFISDGTSEGVRRVDAVTGIITSVAGSGRTHNSGDPRFGGDGGPPNEAFLSEPTGLALDADGNLYIADSFNMRIRKVTGVGE